MWQIANECNSVASERNSEPSELTSEALDPNSDPWELTFEASEFNSCFNSDYDRRRNSDDDELSDGCSSDGSNSMLSEDLAESRQRMDDYFESLASIRGGPAVQEDYSVIFQS